MRPVQTIILPATVANASVNSTTTGAPGVGSGGNAGGNGTSGIIIVSEYYQ